MLRAGLGLLVALALVPTATTLAAWTDQATARGQASSSATITPVLTCEPMLASARVRWPAVSSPTSVTYTARVVGGGSLSPVAAGSMFYVDVSNLLGSLLSPRTYVVEVTGALPGTAWTSVSTRSITSYGAGLLVSC
jgi:hypothetical protein